MDLSWMEYLIPGKIEHTEQDLAILKARKKALDKTRIVEYLTTSKEMELLSELQSDFAEMIIKTLNEGTRQGLFLYLFCGGRTFKQQADLYKLGRDELGNIVNKKLIVTYAKSGDSWHNYFLAADIVMNMGRRPEIYPTWKDAIDANGDGLNDWEQLGEIAKSYGLEWGGDFKTLIDVPHVQYHKGIASITEAREIYKVNDIMGIWQKIEAA